MLKWTFKNARFTMRNIIIQCLLYGSLTLGIWTTIFIYFHHNHVKNQEKKIQEKGNPLIWSLGKKLQTEHGSVQIPRPYVRVKRPNEDETTEQKSFIKLGKYFDFLC